MTNRRNDEEFDARLMQRLDKQDDDALPENDEDAAELIAMQRALSSYREQSLDWAEKRSAAMPSPLPPTSPRAAWRQAPRWALGMATLCACLVGGAAYTHHQAMRTQTAAAALPAAPTQQALAADNQLLSSVDDALRGAATPSEQELGLTDELLGDRAQTRRHAQQRSN